MIKKLLLAVGILVVLVIVAVGAVVIYIDSIAKSAVERAATTALGVQTTVGGMDIAILGGECEMDGLTIANPAGYSTDHFFYMDHAEIAVRLGSLREDRVIIPRLELEGIDINLEKQQGKANYEVILENLRKQQTQEPTPEEEAEGKKFMVERLVVRNTTVHTQVFGTVPVPVVIPEIILEDVGSDTEGGLLLDQLSGTIIEAVMTSVYRIGGDQLPEEIAGPLGDSLQSLTGIGEGGFKMLQGIEQLGNDPEKGLGNILEGAGKAIEGVRDTTENFDEVDEGTSKTLDDVDKAIEGLGGLLNQNKKPAENEPANEGEQTGDGQ